MAALTQEEKDRRYLAANDVFWRFLEGLHNERESLIKDLKGAETTKIHETAGAISALTDILNGYDWESAQKRLAKL